MTSRPAAPGDSGAISALSEQLQATATQLSISIEREMARRALRSNTGRPKQPPDQRAGATAAGATASVKRRSEEQHAKAAKKARKRAPAPRPPKVRKQAPPGPKVMSEKQQAKAAVMTDLVPMGKEFLHAPGSEPFRMLPLQVNMEPQLDVPACRLFQQRQRRFHELLPEARREEQIRVAKEKEQRKGTDEKASSMRPDHKVFQKMRDNKEHSSQEERTFGHVPGIPILARFALRDEMLAVGAHLVPMAGIAYRSFGKALLSGCNMVAESIVAAGGFEDDEDDGTFLLYTGEGGNDLLGNKEQTADQRLIGANLALIGNVHTGIPVRVYRGIGKEPNKFYSYDGLYNVVSWVEVRGKKGFKIYHFRLKRLSGQANLPENVVMFVGGSRKADQARREELRKKHVHISDDWTQGLGGIQLPVVNDHDQERPPLAVAGMPGVGELQYVQECVRGPGVPIPEMASMPVRFVGDPHKYIKQLNGGELPYFHDEKSGVSQLRDVKGVVYECGPWTGCKGCQDGAMCTQAASQKPMQHKLELFKSRSKGWGLRALETIPSGAFVSAYAGMLLPTAVVAPAGYNGMYVFDCGKRDDFLADGSRCKDGTKDPHHEEAHFVVDAANVGNLARFVNHSCDPNLFAQPVLSNHHDVRQSRICFFAAKTITLYEELTLDYGALHLEDLPSCCCGARLCNKPYVSASP